MKKSLMTRLHRAAPERIAGQLYWELQMWKVPQVMATIGPTLEKPEQLRQAIVAGARWFRLPCGYRQRPHLENARCVRAAAAQTGTPVQLLLDLPSSRPRTGSMGELHLAVDQRVVFCDSEAANSAPEQPGRSPVPLPGLGALMGSLAEGHRFWFCDGRLEFVLDELGQHWASAHLTRGSIPLKSFNAIYLPDSTNPFTMLTADDRALLEAFAKDQLTPDWIALSLVCSPADVNSARDEVARLLGSGVRIMAKFETVAALEQADAIIDAADGIMVARGDLGPAVGFLRLPEAQEMLVAAARNAGKPAVVATQVLEVFADTGLPQRAELSDLSLIARQRADAVMLGKETVYSGHPIECIAFAAEMLAYETRRLERSVADDRPRTWAKPKE